MDYVRAPTADQSLRELIAGRVESGADHPYLLAARSERSVSYRELGGRVEDWARVLDHRGVAAGGRVALLVQDPLVFATTFLGVIAAGRTAVPVNLAAPAAEVARMVALDEPALLVADSPARVVELAVPGVVVGADGRPIAELGDPRGAVAAGRGFLRLSTSGSTGAPKAVELTERNLLHVAGSVAAHHGLTSADRGFCSLPLFHINAEVVGLLATLVAGGTLVLDDRFHRNDFWTSLEAHEVTWLNAVPAIYAILARDPIPLAPPRLRFVRSASAPLPARLRRSLETALGVPVVESYGMTEAASQITATALDASAPAGSAGRAAGAEIQVRTSTGTPAAVEEVGRVWIRGAGVITGYADGRATERFDPAGWLDTGDLGHLDADGFLFLAGRADDVINRGGELIHPREIQEVLLADARVSEAVVVARPDEILGQVPVALLITAGEVDPVALLADLETRCVAQLSRFKRPVAFEIVTELPRSATGKVQTHRVRAELVRT